VGLGFELRASCLQIQSIFCCGYFEMESHKLFCLGWPWTTVLLISASKVARLIGLNLHRQRLASY
jgi:hypothetical protein